MNSMDDQDGRRVSRLENLNNVDDLAGIRYRTAKHVPVDYDGMGYGKDKLIII